MRITKADHFLIEKDAKLYCHELAEILKQYGEHVRDTTLEWAAEQADTESYTSLMDHPDFRPHIRVNKTSILSGKTSKELEL